jgi:hypothetical protein
MDMRHPMHTKELMQKLRRVSAALLVAFAFVMVSVGRASADDTMEQTLKDSIYGGIIGALVGSAVVLLTENPDEHLDYIPTGAGVGILIGAAYGLATSGVMQTVELSDDGWITLDWPSFSRARVFDNFTNDYEIIETLRLIKVNF